MIESDRLVSPASQAPEPQQDWAIRPKRLDDYIGQPQVCEQMTVFMPVSYTHLTLPTKA